MTRPFIVLDCEATPMVKMRECRADNSLVYDLGWIVTDGETVFEKRSFVITDIFYADFMTSAYYVKKLPLYHIGLFTGEWIAISMINAKNTFADDCAKYGVRDVWAYNCQFDEGALAHTIEYLSNGFCSTFFPSNVRVRDIWSAVGSTICATKKYVDWCFNNGYVSKKGNPSTSAETVYRYIIDADFIEAHTALADCEIECEILIKVRKRHQRFKQTSGQGWREASNIAKAMK